VRASHVDNSDPLRYWYRSLERLDRKIAAIEAGELVLHMPADRAAVYVARENVAGLIAELRRK
jgi:hypothetical protein